MKVLFLLLLTFYLTIFLNKTGYKDVMGTSYRAARADELFVTFLSLEKVPSFSRANWNDHWEVCAIMNVISMDTILS